MNISVCFQFMMRIQYLLYWHILLNSLIVSNWAVSNFSQFMNSLHIPCVEQDCPLQSTLLLHGNSVVCGNWFWTNTLSSWRKNVFNLSLVTNEGHAEDLPNRSLCWSSKTKLGCTVTSTTTCFWLQAKLLLFQRLKNTCHYWGLQTRIQSGTSL